MSEKGLKVVFMGTPEFAVAHLAALQESPHQVVGVVTMPDKPSGRGRKLRPSPVKRYAQEHGLALLQPEKLKNPYFHAALRALKADLFVVVAFRMLPKSVWSIPPHGTINLHASLLPSYRGAAPINWAIINGEKETGVSTFFINEQIDAGDLLLQSKTPIHPSEDAGQLHDRLKELGAATMLATVDQLRQGSLESQNQDLASKFPSAPKLDKLNTQIDWTMSAEGVERLVRGLSPYPAAWTAWDGQGESVKVKIYRCVHSASAGIEAGEVFLNAQGELLVGTGTTNLRIEELQLPGKRKMTTTELLNGMIWPTESRFS